VQNDEMLVSLDIGTSEVKIIIGEVQSDTVNIIGVGTSKTKGLKKGSIVDIDETVLSIKEAVQRAEHMVDMKIDNVVLTVNSHQIQLHSCHGVVAVQSENREIGNEDVKRVIDGAQVMSIPPEREIIDVIPKQFIVDGQDGITDPRGMIGVRLEMEGTVITCSKTILHNFIKCIEKADLYISDICLQPIAAGTIALSNDEQNLGVALVDIGGGSTTISVFENHHLVTTTVMPLGGDNITKDISIGLRTSTEEAEELKLNYGHAYYDHASEAETFEVNVIGNQQKVTFNQLEIANIIEARLEEIYDLIFQELRRLGFTDLPGGVVLTGGSMKLEGALELAQELFPFGSRISIPNYIGVREPQFTAGVGTILFAYRNAKIQGKDLEPSLVGATTESVKVKKPRKQKSEKKEGSKFGNFFKYFFE